MVSMAWILRVHMTQVWYPDILLV